MLVDLEGLNGSEVLDPARALVQDNLVSALLIVASVSCILVHNSMDSLRFVKQQVGRIARLQRTYGFRMDRVWLLFQDTDMIIAYNSDFIYLASNLNQEYFEGKPVIKLLNKPDFRIVDSTKRDEFIQTLLTDSLFIKRNASGLSVYIKDLLNYIGLIGNHPNRDISNMISFLEECNTIIAEKRHRLRSIASEVVSQDNIHLLWYFNEKLREDLVPTTGGKQDNINEGVRAYCKKRIDSEVKLIKMELLEIEACHSLIRVVSAEAMVTIITQLVDYLYRAAWCVIDFKTVANELHLKLQQIQQRFPQSQGTMQPVLEAFEAERYSCYRWSAGIYAAQVLLTAATFGLGGLVGSGVTAARAGAAAVAARILLGRLVGLGIGLIFNAGICANLVISEKAEEFIQIRPCGEPNQKVVKYLKENPHKQVPLLLLIGTKSTFISTFANFFVRYIAPFTPAESCSFRSDKYAQVLSFDYFHPELPQSQGDPSSTQCYLICLCFDDDPLTPTSIAVQTIANVLIPAATLTCILVPPDPHYTLLRAVCPAQEVKSTAKLAAITKDQRGMREMRHVMEGFTGDAQVLVVEDFEEGSIAEEMDKVKTAFDHSKVQKCSLLLEKLLALPTAIQH